MEIPPRREIWRVRLQGEGTEIGAKKDPERPCLIVSSDLFNDGSERLTVVPLTDYADGKEDTMAHWGVSIRLKKDIEGYNPRPGDETREKSIVDCGQIYTIPLNWLDDSQWKHRYGKLTDVSMIRVDIALQALLAGTIGYNPYSQKGLPFWEGDVLEANLPEYPHHRCLVVSSATIDLLRDRIWIRKLNRHLRHCTIVPLHPGDEEGPTIIPIIIQPEDQADFTIERAMCREVQTIDWHKRTGWRQRKGLRIVGRVENEYLSKVRKALRQYLHLPKTVEELTDGEKDTME